MVQSSLSRGSILAVLMVCLSATTYAQGGPSSASSGDFQFRITPYAWLTGLSGTVGAKGVQTNINKSFSNLSGYLNLAAMVNVDVMYRDTVGILADFNYSLLGDQSSRKLISLDGKTSLILSDVAAYYRLGTASMGKEAGTASFDLLAGARIWSLALGLDVNSHTAGRTISEVRTWADPIIGGRVLLRFTDRWALILRGGVGGFGVSSQFTWDAMALVGYTFWEHGTLLLGYRGVGVNYTEGSGRNRFVFDTTLHGPVLGLAFTF